MATLASKLRRDASWSAIAAAAWDAPGWKAAAIEYRAAHPAWVPSVEPEAPRHPSWYCETCDSRPCVNPTFCRACRAADKHVPPLSEQTKRLRRLMDDNISYEHAYREFMNNRPAPQALIDALVHSLRRGISKLIRPDVQRRLSVLSEDQLELVCDRVQNFKARIAPAWSVADVDLLISAWRKFHENR